MVTGVAANWRLVENFELLTPGPIIGQGNWLTAVPSTNGDPTLATRIRNERTASYPSSWEFLVVHFAQNTAFDIP